MRKAKPVKLTETMRNELLKLKRGAKTPQRLVQRSSIVLLAEESMANDEIGARLGLTPHKVARWRNRYIEKGLAGILNDQAGRGRKATIKPEQKTQLVRLTLETTPEMATHWSTRRMAKVVGLSATTVRAIWHTHGLKPHLVRGFKRSNDKRFVEKLRILSGSS